MLLKLLGLENLPTQKGLYEFSGGPFSIELLAQAMNEVSAPYEWWGECFFAPNGNWQPVYARVNSTAPWIARLQQPRVMGHWVVVPNVTTERIDILDPDPGIAYWMTRQEFESVWSGHAVYLRELPL